MNCVEQCCSNPARFLENVRTLVNGQTHKSFKIVAEVQKHRKANRNNAI